MYYDPRTPGLPRSQAARPSRDAPSAQREDVLQLNNALQSTSIGNIIREEIAQLGGHIQSINSLFNKVIGPLEEFDEVYLASSPGEHLAPKWRDIQRLFEGHIDMSRRSAAAATGIMRSYALAVLANVGRSNCNIRELVGQISRTKGAVAEQKHTAQQTRSDFKDLSNEVRAFERKIKRTVAGLNIRISEIMIKTCDDIGELKQKVATLFEQISAQESSLLAKMAAFAPGSSKVLCTLLPKAMSQAMQSTRPGPTTNAYAQRQKAQAKLEQYAAQMPALLECGRIPSALRPFYQEWWANAGEDIRGVSRRMEAISSIWDHLHMDLTELESHMSMCSGEDSASDSTFLMAKIDVSRTVFNRLAECLEQYVHQVPQGRTAHAGHRALA